MRIPRQAPGITRGSAQPLVRNAVQAAAPSFGTSRVAQGGTGFNCNHWFCSCTGDDDCNDMFTTNACGPIAICIDDVCFCGRP
jgi:hypothetical protein